MRANAKLEFSVVVPFHNSSRYIRSCLEHLLNQDYDPQQFEIIFVDNGSTDGSAAIVREFPRVRLLSESQPGSYAARNRALREAGGRLIAFTDSDCATDPHWLRSFDEALREPGVGLVLGQQRPCHETPLLAGLADYETRKVAFICEGRDPLLYYGFTNNMGVHRELLDRYGPFEQRARGADTFFVRRVVDGESAAAVRYLPDAVVRHLEMDSALAYWRKMYTYGRSMTLGRHVIRRRNFNMAERIATFRQTARDGRYAPVRTGSVFGALACGLAAWNLGRFTARCARGSESTAAS